MENGDIHTNSQGADRLGEMQDQAELQLERARDALMAFNGRALSFIKERPGTCLVGAVAAGFLIGRLVSRR